VSNPELPRSYWQDQDDAGYGLGWRGSQNGAPRDQSPWDDSGAHFWRGDNGSRYDRGAGRVDADPPSRRGQQAAADPGPADSSWPGAVASRWARGRRRRDEWAADDSAAGGHRRNGRANRWTGQANGAGGYAEQDYSADRVGRISQTAEDLRNRLGMRGSASSRGRGNAGRVRSGMPVQNGYGPAGQPADDFLAESAGGGFTPGVARTAGTSGRNGASRFGSGLNGSDYDRDSHYGPRRARNGAATDYEDFGDGRPNGYTALRDQPEWLAEDGGRDGLRSRISARTDVSRGGGRRGGRGGGWDGGGRDLSRTRSQRFKQWLRSGDWWRHWTWKKVLGLIGAGVAAVILLGVIGFFVIYEMTPIPTDASETALWNSSEVYFSNGKLLGTFSANGINRQTLAFNQIPTVMDNAMLAAEDRNFYHEGGISITGLARAAFEDLFGSGGLQGGSTITEEYAKNYYANIGTSRTISTKIKEIFISIKLAHERSKQWILDQYLNTVDFGNGAYGVGAAAEAYFGKNLSRPGTTLTLAQAAMLAAMPNQPSYFSPDPSAGAAYQALVARWQYVLTNMVRDNAITQQQATGLCVNCSIGQAEKVFAKVIKVVPPGQSSGFTGWRFFLMSMVQAELEHDYGLSLHQIETMGLRINTTFNQSMVQGLNRAVAQDEHLMRVDGQALPWYAHAAAALIDPKTGGILAIYGGPGPGVMSNKRCNVLDCWDNSAEVPHQPGSSFKPYVLATAIHEDMDVQGSVLNGYSPICVPPDWTEADQTALSARISPAACAAKEPEGYWLSTDSSYGGIPPAEAAAVSSNTAFEDLAHKVGISKIINMAGNLGVGSANEFNIFGGNDLTLEQKTFGNGGTNQGSVTISLGASGADLTAIEQASTFATLAADGLYHTPHVLASVTGPGGKAYPSKVVVQQALTPQEAADEDYALSFDNTPTYAAQGATGYPAAAWDRPVIAKTGTTNTGQDAWFIGAIPQYSLAVTLYTNQQNSASTPGAQSLNVLPTLPGPFDTGGYGGAWPATIWRNFMGAQFSNLPIVQLPPTDFGAPFIPWHQVPAGHKNKQTCKPGQGFFGRCNPNCPPGSGRQCSPSPSPTPTCGQVFGQPCSPSPTPSCGQAFGPPCSPSPSVSPSPTVSPTCTPLPGQPCTTLPPGQVGGVKTATLTAAFSQLATEPSQAVLAGRLRQFALSRRI